MHRTQWKKERRLWNEVRMDTIDARQYDERWGSYINPTHRAMVERFLELCPPKGHILDAACGTGKYWSLLLEREFTVVGTDTTDLDAYGGAQHFSPSKSALPHFP